MYAIVFLWSADAFAGAVNDHLPDNWEMKSQQTNVTQIYNQFCILGGEQVFRLHWNKVEQIATVRSIQQVGITKIQERVVNEGWITTSKNAAVVDIVGNSDVFLQELTKCNGDHASIQALLSQGFRGISKPTPALTFVLRSHYF